MQRVEIAAFRRDSSNSVLGSITVLSRVQRVTLFLRRNIWVFVLGLSSMAGVGLRASARGRLDSLPFTVGGGFLIGALIVLVIVHGQRERARAISVDAGDRTWFARGELKETTTDSNRALPPGVVNVFATDTGIIAVADEDRRWWTDVAVERVDAVVGPTGKLASLSLLIGGDSFELRAMAGRVQLDNDPQHVTHSDVEDLANVRRDPDIGAIAWFRSDAEPR